MLENYIEANQRQMQFLADEINRVGNITLNNNQFLRVLKRHSWKGLRKFNSVKGLRKDRVYKEYEHLQRTFSRDDTVDRPNQKIPPLHKIDEVFFVNEPEPIRPDTVSENDSITSKDDDGLDDSDLDINLITQTRHEAIPSSSSEEESSGDQSSSDESSPSSASSGSQGADAAK